MTSTINVAQNSTTNKVSSVQKSPLNSIQACIADDILAVNHVIEQSLHSKVALVNQVAHYIINSGGKRLRPILVLLSGGLFGEVKAQHHQLAAVVEFIHTATLLHDDVVMSLQNDAAKVRQMLYLVMRRVCWWETLYIRARFK